MADTKETLYCPACRSKMDKIFIERIGKNLDICQNCGGIFFDNQEFKHFDEKCESIEEIEKVFINKEFKKVDQNAARYCPNCGAKMVRNSKGVIIDECYTCGGKFLDGGELLEYRSEYDTDKERSMAFVKTLIEEIEEMKKQEREEKEMREQEKKEKKL